MTTTTTLHIVASLLRHTADSLTLSHFPLSSVPDREEPVLTGMQVLFASSAKSPSVRSLGVMPCQIDHFHDTDKAVPHMGWNTTECFDSPSDPLFTEGISPTSFYYFVHSYCASYDPTQNFKAAQWAHSTMQYGNKVFVSTVHKGSIFGTQFHPEKSGITGLTILDMWIKKPWLGYPSTCQALYTLLSKTKRRLYKTNNCLHGCSCK